MEKQYLDGIDVVYWINLDRAKDRREHMEKNVIIDEIFDDKKVIRLKAIDYKDKNLDKYLKVNVHNKVTNKEYACLASHLEAIRAFSKTDYKNALIFEDDVSLDYKKYWTKTIQEIINGAPKNWEILKVCVSPQYKLQSLYTLWKAKSLYKNGTFQNYADWSCAAYIINNKAANKFMNQLYKHGKYQLPDNSFHVADFLIYDMLTTYTYKYPFFTIRKNNISYIQIVNNCKDVKKKAFENRSRNKRMSRKQELFMKKHKAKTMKRKQ
jgi:GR25 family glycosyltransferase involved in LPS biosynthesis